MGVLDKRVVLVTGKGGVGKTLVAALIALRASRAGLRTILCETWGAQQVGALFGKPTRGYAPTQLSPTLATLSITSDASMEEYLLRVLKFRTLYDMVFKNRVMGPFVDAVPGLHDLMQLGKVWDLERTTPEGRPATAPGARAWDLIVVDAPATGHGLTMLDSPRAMMDMTVAGPFHDNARAIAELVESPARTGIVLVTLPEEVPARETEDLWSRLGRFRASVCGVVINGVEPPAVPDVAFFERMRTPLGEGANPPGRDALRLADRALARALRQRDTRARLRTLGGAGAPHAWAELPRLAAPPNAQDLDALVRGLEGL